jgi:aspartate aminotransferase-like enzyme
VDGITAVGAYPVLMDEWDLDGLVAGSQKAFMLPTGLSFVSLSQRAWKKKQNMPSCSYYWDLSLEKKANEKQQTYFSSNITLIRALQVSIELILEKGLPSHYAEIAARAGVTHEFLQTLGLKSFCASPSESITAIEIPWGSSALRDHLEKQYQLTLMDGQDELKNQLLRVGHMGYIPREHLMESLRRIYLGIKDLEPNFLKLSEEEMAAWLRHRFSPLKNS